MKKSRTIGEIRIVVDLGESSLSPRRHNDVEVLSKHVSRLTKELVEDLAIPASVQVTVQEPTDGDPLLVSINGESCRMRRQFGNGSVSAKKLAEEIADVLLQNREKLIDITLAGSIADSIRDEQESIYLAGLSRAAFHDYLRLLVRRCFRVDRGAHLSGSAGDTPKQWNSQDCFEEAVSSPLNLRVVVYRAVGSTDDLQHENDNSIGDALGAMREDMFYELGIRVPKIALSEDALLGPNEIRLQINDVRLPSMKGLAVHEFLVNETVDRLSLLNIKGRKAVNPTNETESAIVRGNDAAEACKQASFTTWGRNEYAAHIAGVQLRKFAGSLVVPGTVEDELNQLKDETPELVDIVGARFDLKSIVRFLRYLADEGISCRNLRGILEALLTTSTTSGVDFGKHIVFNPYAMTVTPAFNTGENESDSVRTYAEAIRSNLKSYISNKYTRGQSTLVVYLLDPKIESLMKESSERALSADEREDILDALEQEVGDLPPSAQNPVILTSIDARRAFRDLIAIEFPNMAVLSYQELSPDLNIQPIARISLG